ncbi:MAG: metallophosphoesterase [Candidatus Thermoplasmatota archaeon]|nr:metallophosphoesterase [Candidatus Thermoplasmatota archaeon]
MGNFYKIKAVLRLKKKDNWEVKLLFLGDYIDRAPKDVKNGGFLTLLYLLCAKMIHKEEIFMLRGNHEAIDLLTFAPYELPIEISDIFGEKISEDVHEILMKIFSELPLFLKTGNGLIASHAGFIAILACR